MDFSSANWTNVASLAIAFIALLASFGSFAVSFRAFRLSQRQDDRKKPALVPSFLNGYVQFFESKKVRAYAFLLSISNLSDSNNALARVELHVTYETPARAIVTAKIPSSQTRGDAYAELHDFPLLSLPARLDAHQTLAGWIIFHVSEEVLKDATIEGYTIALFDTHQIETSVKPIMVQEYAYEVVSPLRENLAPR